MAGEPEPDVVYVYELRRPDGTVLYRNVNTYGGEAVPVDLPLGPFLKGAVETWIKAGDGEFEFKWSRDFGD